MPTRCMCAWLRPAWPVLRIAQDHADLFTEIAMDVHRVAAPISRQKSPFDIPVEAGVGPIDNPRHKPVLDRIIVDIADVSLQISFVANSALPITSLPNSLFSFLYFAGRAQLRSREASREIRFEETPARREIAIAVR